jgi:hypothetical protein
MPGGPIVIVLFILGQLPTNMPQVEQRSVQSPLFQFSVARGEFSDAVDQLRAAFWNDKDRKKAADKIESNVNVFLRYIRTVSHERPVFEPGDLKKLSSAQLASETLSLAQRLRPELRRVVRNERSAVVPVTYWEFLYKLESDLLRLKWMSSQLH